MRLFIASWFAAVQSRFRTESHFPCGVSPAEPVVRDHLLEMADRPDRQADELLHAARRR